jgi:type II secretory pathway component PulF
MATDRSVGATGLRLLADQMKQRFSATMTDFTGRVERMRALHEETLKLPTRLVEREVATVSAPEAMLDP